MRSKISGLSKSNYEQAFTKKLLSAKGTQYNKNPFLLFWHCNFLYDKTKHFEKRKKKNGRDGL